MRISQFYKLGRTQPTLDFIDVDVNFDTPLFVDPHALRILPNIWAEECVSLVQSFFQTVLNAIHDRNDNLALKLLGVLHEPNETHLGLSKGKSKGRALGPYSARYVWDALRKSEAVKSGLLEDLEDTILMIEGISSDIISDVTTNIIRGPLIQYTQDMSHFYGIQLVKGVNSGPIWDSTGKTWHSHFTSLPMTRCGKILLVPKSIIRIKMEYDVDEYYRHYVLEHLQEIELSSNTELVQLLKNGSKRVTKKDVIAKYGSGKSIIVSETREYPQILERYRSDKLNSYRSPLSHYDISEVEGTLAPNWQALLNSLISIRPGSDDANEYEKAIESFFTAIFYPSLTNPIVHSKIHDGRKIIDITYTNVAREGFFFWIGLHYSCANIFIECKNYSNELGNPELDQISGRFSPSRGQIGIITCRHFENKDLFLRRCQDTAHDQRGFIIALDDDDLRVLMEEKVRNPNSQDFTLLYQRFLELIN